MMTAPQPPKKRRVWMPFWRLPVMPMCPVHNVPMECNGTREMSDGLTVQYRRCPCEGCDETRQTTYRR